MIGLLLAAALPVAVVPREAAWPEGFQVERRERWVELDAGNLDGLRRALADMRSEQGWHGLTRGGIEIGADLLETPQGCELGALRTTVQLEVVLPRLRDVDEAPERLRQAWGRMAEGLAVHEDGHVAIAIEGALLAHRRLREAPPFADCRAARRAVLREQWRIQAAQDLAHERYDRRTRFGATQGAELVRRRMVVPLE